MPRPTEILPFQTTVTRVIAGATPAQVFDAWTRRDQLTWLIGKKGSATIDLRVGGAYTLEMEYNHKLYHHEGEYLRIERPHLLEFTWISDGTEHRVSVVKVQFEAAGSGTRVSIHHTGLPEKMVKDHEQGWTELAGWLDDQLHGRGSGTHSK